MLYSESESHSEHWMAVPSDGQIHLSHMLGDQGGALTHPSTHLGEANETLVRSQVLNAGAAADRSLLRM